MLEICVLYVPVKSESDVAVDEFWTTEKENWACLQRIYFSVSTLIEKVSGISNWLPARIILAYVKTVCLKKKKKRLSNTVNVTLPAD